VGKIASCFCCRQVRSHDLVDFCLFQAPRNHRRRASQTQISAKTFQFSKTTNHGTDGGAVHRRHRGQIKNYTRLLLRNKPVDLTFQLAALRAAVNAASDGNRGHAGFDLASRELQCQGYALVPYAGAVPAAENPRAASPTLP